MAATGRESKVVSPIPEGCRDRRVVVSSGRLQEINIYSHSTLLYWWPAWAFGFVFTLLNAGQEKFLATAQGGQPSSALGLPRR
jgi:hypothetical protein